MRKILGPNRLAFVTSGVGVYTLSIYLVPIDTLILFLNSILFGTGAAILVAYWPLLRTVFMGREPYDRVQQLTVGSALAWIAIALAVAGSAYAKMSDLPAQNTALLAAGRFCAIIAAILVVTAPDFGNTFFHGKTRKTLLIGTLIGIVVAGLLAYGQGTAVLAE